ncbi:hypothetical protein LGM65_07600 [Burkholderia anthina]|uniref:hypothetical protein n=1 Tax=Burkholderia anthina TaxID=179879 RepID=UPI001CF2EFBA|nr:hypothetical protein [Burkholderia anthina]MCA8090761.1 hypothetical protein [Burkholderia anthina]
MPVTSDRHIGVPPAVGAGRASGPKTAPLQPSRRSRRRLAALIVAASVALSGCGLFGCGGAATNGAAAGGCSAGMRF